MVCGHCYSFAGNSGSLIIFESLNEFNLNLCFQKSWSLTKGRDCNHLRTCLRNQPEGCPTRLECYRANAVFSCCVQQNSTRRAEKNFTLVLRKNSILIALDSASPSFDYRSSVAMSDRHGEGRSREAISTGPG